MFAVPHTPVVFGGPLVQSALVQQPAVGMQRLVLGQFLNAVELQAMAQVPELQTAEPFAAGVGQETQVAPHALVLVSGWQVLLQICVPDGQTPAQGVETGMQVPAHSLVCEGQVGAQARPSHVTEPPPVGA